MTDTIWAEIPTGYFPLPIDAIALGVSVAAGAGALATDLADPNFRHGMGRLLTGHFDKESLGALATGVGDVMSVVPGGKVLATEARFATSLEKAPSIVEVASTVAHQPGLLAKGLSKIPNIGKALETARLIDKGAGDITMINQNMLNILLHGRSVATHAYQDVTQ